MVFGLFRNINLVGTAELLVERKISHLKLEFSSFHAPPKLGTCFHPCTKLSIGIASSKQIFQFSSLIGSRMGLLIILKYFFC